MARNRGELLPLYDKTIRLVEPGVVQEMIREGSDERFSYAALCSDEHVIASLAARRTTQYLGDFCCTSCLVETIESTEVEELRRVSSRPYVIAELLRWSSNRIRGIGLIKFLA